jgi:hypothetical protein
MCAEGTMTDKALTEFNQMPTIPVAVFKKVKFFLAIEQPAV